MKNRISILALCLVVLAGLSSCKQFGIGDANKMQRSMTQAQALDLASKGPRDTYKNAALNLDVQVYALSMGNVTSDYLLAFKNDKLIYWGYPYEFMRHSDPAIVEIGRWTVEKIEKDR